MKTGKRILSIFLVVLLLLTAAPLAGFVGLPFAFAEDATIVDSGTDGNLTWMLDSAGMLTVSGNGRMNDGYYYTLDNTGYHTNAPWGKYYQTILAVVLVDGVTSIGKFAFYGCTALTSVTIPDSVTIIDQFAFYHCTALASVTIPNSVTKIAYQAFCGCTALTSVTIPGSVTSIDLYTFAYCSSLTSVTIPDSVTSIDRYAFQYCSKLTMIDVGANNTKYSSVDGVLFNKTQTSLIQYPIGNPRTDYTIPDSVTSIGDAAFFGCSSLTSITIPDSVTSIGGRAFEGCSSLTSVTIPNSVTSIGGSAFYDCSSLTSVMIPDSVTSIGILAFRGCSSLTSVTIPESVTSIGSPAFDYCTSLTSITVNENNPAYVSDSSGCLYNKNKTELIQYPIGNVRLNFSIPNSVTSICKRAFQSCTALTSVTIPDSVTSIGECAFEGCSSLTSIMIPDSITSIGAEAFYGCSSLTSVTIPDSVTSIGLSTFGCCSSLTSVTIPDSVTSIRYYAFSSCSSLKDVYYAGTEEEWNNIEIEDDNECLTNAAIHFNSTGGTELNRCGDNASWFYMSLNKTLHVFGTGELWDFDDNNAPWRDEYGLEIENIIISSGITRIGNRAFCALASLKSADIPDSLESIGTKAFENTGLSRVHIPNSVKTIYQNAFRGCSEMTDVYFNGTRTQWNNITIGYGNECLTNATLHVYVDDTAEYDDSFDQELYSETTFNPRGVDNNSFINGKSQSWFGFNKCKDYYIEDDALREALLLMAKLSSPLCYVNTVNDMYSDWHGACYGIERVVAAAYLDSSLSTPISIDTNGAGFFNYSPYLEPITNQTFLDQIHFNDLLQDTTLLGQQSSFSYYTYYNTRKQIEDKVVGIIAGDHGHTLSNDAFWKQAIKDAKRENNLLLFNDGSHAVLVTDAYELPDGRVRLIVFDCNNILKDRIHKTWSPLNCFTVNKDGTVFYTYFDSDNFARITKNVSDYSNSYSYINLDEQKSSKSRAKVKAPIQEQINSHMFVAFDAQNDFCLRNEEGEYIFVKNNDIDATMKVYEMSDLYQENAAPLLLFEIDKTDHLVFESNEATKLMIGDFEQYETAYIVEGDRLISVIYDQKDGLQLNKDICNFTISCGKTDKDEKPEVLRLSGTANGDVLIGKSEDDAILIKSECVLDNLNIEQLTDNEANTLMLPTEDSIISFTIQNDDTITIINENNTEHTHTYTSTVTTEPTCIEDGETTYTCSCGDTYTEPIPATGNHLDADNDGYCDTCEQQMTGGDHCKYCGKIHDGFFGWLVKFFHSIFAIFKR